MFTVAVGLFLLIVGTAGGCLLYRLRRPVDLLDVPADAPPAPLTSGPAARELLVAEPDDDTRPTLVPFRIPRLAVDEPEPSQAEPDIDALLAELDTGQRRRR